MPLRSGIKHWVLDGNSAAEKVPPQLSSSLPGTGETNRGHCLDLPRRRSPWICEVGIVKEHKRHETDTREGQGRWAEEHLMCSKTSHTSVRNSLNSEPNSVPTFPCLAYSVNCGEKEGPQGHCSVERHHKKAFTGTTAWQRGPSAHCQKGQTLSYTRH